MENESSYYFNYGSDELGQCEIDFARCGLNKKGHCAWLGGRDYRKCKLKTGIAPFSR